MLSIPQKRIIIYIDVLLYLLCLAGIYQIMFKPDIPFTLEKENASLTIEKSSSHPGIASSILKNVDGIKFSSREELEAYIDSKNIGEPIVLKLKNDKSEFRYVVNTVRFYSDFYVFSVIFTGTLFYLIAIFVLLKSTEKKPALLFHWVVVSTAIIMMTTWGNINALPFYAGILLRSVFHLSYLIAPVLFLYFNWSFPLDRSLNKQAILILLTISAIVISTIQIIVFSKMITASDFITQLHVYINWFNYGRILFVGCVAASLFTFVHSFITIKSSAEQKKLKWLLLGYLIGPASFVILWVIPQAVTGEGLIPEELMIMLMVSIPVTFAISILKYHLMDIDLILNRSFVYAIVIGVLLTFYISVLTVIARYAEEYTRDFPIVAAIIIVIIFQPVKEKVQKFVDVKFFRVKYNYRLASRKLLQEISNCTNLLLLSDKTINEINSLIPVKRSAFFIFNKNDKSISMLTHLNMEKLQRKKYYLKKVENIFYSPIGRKDSLEPGVSIQSGNEKIFRIFDIALILPVKSAENELLAYFILGRKKSDTRYSVEDVDLLLQVASEAGLTMERIYLNEKYIAEHFEKQKLEELNQLKSFFVSSVSHELKTPLTSIKMFSEILNRSENLKNSTREEYFRIIDEECSRLVRMIDNVLNIVKIEKGIKNYRFDELNVDQTVEEAMNIMQYQLASNKFTSSFIKGPGNKYIYADKDALHEVLVNLISNSIKYSRDTREIKLSTCVENSLITLTIEDKGIGIAAEDISSIFQPYFRSNDTEAGRTAGTGLGLAIVKHVIDAHNGTIKVESEYGKGTTFSLKFRQSQTEGLNEKDSGC